MTPEKEIKLLPNAKPIQFQWQRGEVIHFFDLGPEDEEDGSIVAKQSNPEPPEST